jgi:hypothetical protein
LISVTPEAGATSLLQAGFTFGQGEPYSPQAIPPGGFRVGVATQAGTSLHAGGLSSPQDSVVARTRAQAGMPSIRIRTLTP